MRVALLTADKRDWVSPLALRCNEVEWIALHPSAVGLKESPNPFALPVDDRADLVVLERSWYYWLQRFHHDRAGAVLDRLERLGLVGMDGADDFQLGFPPAVLARVRLMLKAQGVYRDRDLYNYALGPWHSKNRSWTEKRHAWPERYGGEDLEKLRLSVPCLLVDLPAFKRAARRREKSRASGTLTRSMSAPERLARNTAELVLWEVFGRAPIRRHRDVHCLVTLTHAQRIDALRELQGLDGTQGIAAVAHGVAGADNRDIGAETAGLLRSGLGRFRFITDVVRHRIVVAPTGYGELGQRHGLALQAGAALVCQDISHVETMFPFRNMENVVYCRADLSDLRDKVDWLLTEEPTRARVARQGRSDYRAWAGRWREHLNTGIAIPLREAAS